ncbi:MAG: HlyU family transcriptional regulator [Alphaproteobacteria bacterium]
MGSRFSDFFRRLVGSGGATASPTAAGKSVEYNGYEIRPVPRREGSQWLTAGVITKPFADGVKEHHFIRADKHGSKDDADALAINKAKRMIDEQGDQLFRDD